MPEFLWRPFDGPQREFCERGEYEVLFGGAKGPGKTDCLIAEAARLYEHPNYHGLILRRTFPRLQEIIDRCWQLYPKMGGEYRASEHRWYFKSGAKITLGHVQHEDDKRNYHGKEFHFIGFDELTEFSSTQYSFILANVRMAKGGLDLQIRATTNPGGPGHVWVKEYFVDTCKPTEWVDYFSGDGVVRKMAVPGVHVDPLTGTSRCFVPATVYDNAAIMINDPGYVSRLEALPHVEKLRLLHGDWKTFEGQVFVELSQRIHGCEPQAIPGEWEKFMAFDWGYAKPWCALWFAVDYDGIIYLYRELYGCKEDQHDIGLRQTNAEICRAILDAEKEKVKYRVADPACWSPTKLRGSNKAHGPSFIEDAANDGLFFLKADNDRLRGKQQCHMRFMLETETDKNGEVIKEYPRFVAFNDCKNWWRTMTQIREDVKNPEDVDTDQEDHLYDTTRYAFMSRPVTPQRKPDIPYGTFQAERRRLIRARKYSREHGVSLEVAYGRVR